MGGAFLLIKATIEIHDRLEAQPHASFWPVIVQIVVLDAVFSLDSVITAIGMVDDLYVMMAAVVAARAPANSRLCKKTREYFCSIGKLPEV